MVYEFMGYKIFGFLLQMDNVNEFSHFFRIVCCSVNTVQMKRGKDLIQIGMRPFGDFFFKAKSSFLFEESLDIVGDIAKTHRRDSGS